MKSYKIEGIGKKYYPGTFDGECFDGWVKVDDDEAFIYAKRVVREEGMLVGGSSGTIVRGAFRYLKQNGLQDKEDLR
jgi:cystathionine beta-synthase